MSRKGFTLIEMVLVILIMAIVTGSLAVVIYQALQDTHKPEVLSTAMALATKELERIIRLDFSDVADENRGSPASYTGNLSSYSWEVRVDSIDDAAPDLGSDADMSDYKVVEVRIHHSVFGYLSNKLLKSNY